MHRNTCNGKHPSVCVDCHIKTVRLLKYSSAAACTAVIFKCPLSGLALIISQICIKITILLRGKQPGVGKITVLYGIDKYASGEQLYKLLRGH